MNVIKDITTIHTIDSSGQPALHVTVHIDDTIKGTACISTGSAFDLSILNNAHDGNKNTGPQNYTPELMTKKIEDIVKPAIVGMDATNQKLVDNTLIQLQTNAEKNTASKIVTSAVSIAVARAGALLQKKPLYTYLRTLIDKESLPIKMPIPMFTLLDGGKSANFSLNMQEFLVIPASFKNFSESIYMGLGLYLALKNILLKDNLSPLVGLRGGYSPLMSTNEDALAIMKETIESVNLRVGYDVYLGMDVNANLFYGDRRYKIKDRAMSLTPTELSNLYDDYYKKFNLLYLEDPMASEDVDGWVQIYKTLNQNVIIAGDNFIKADPLMLQQALIKQTINAVVLKLSHVTSVTEAMAITEMAHAAGIKVVISDKTYDTNDDFLADFAVAAGADYVKFGAPSRGERVAKYNRLIEIAHDEHLM